MCYELTTSSYLKCLIICNDDVDNLQTAETASFVVETREVALTHFANVMETMTVKITMMSYSVQVSMH